MRLPDAIEREIRTIEAEYAQILRQHAGTPRLRGLRWAIEDELKRLGYRYSEEAKVCRGLGQ